MSWMHLLDNPVLRTLPRWVLVMTGAVLALIAGLSSASVDRDFSVGTLFVAAVIWVCVAFYIVTMDLRNRCSLFALTLPVSLHRLWLYHLGGVVLGVSGLFAATAGTLALGALLISRLAGRWVIPMDVITGAILPLYSTLLLVVAVIAGSRSVAQAGRRSAAEVLLATGVVVVGFGVFVGLRRVEPGLWWLPALIAAGVVTMRYRRVPSCLDVAAENPTGDRDRTVTEGTAGPWQPGRWFLDRTIYACMARNVKKKVSPVLTMPFLLAFGALLGGADQAFFNEQLGIAYIPMAVYMLLAFTAHPLAAIPTFDTLPIPRRRVFALLVLPHLLMLTLGYAIGDRMVHTIGSTEPVGLARSRETGRVCCTRVPLSSYEIAWNGETPWVEAPWGERCETRAISLYRGSKVALYTPFVTTDKSSVDFVAWQLSRATGVVFDAAIPADDIRERYLEFDDEGRPQVKSGGVTIVQDYTDRVRRGGGPMMPLVISAVFVLWMLLLAVYLQSFRATLSRTVRRIVLVGVLGVAMLLWIGWFVGAMLHWANPTIVDAFVRIIVRDWGASPLGTLAVWAVSTIACVLAFIWASRRFERMEVLASEVPFGRG